LETAVFDAPLFKIKGCGPHFLDSRGSCWTAAYINEGGNVVRDLRANIAAESPRHLHKRKDPNSGLALIVAAE
jgi:Mn-containing catalase